MLSQAKKPPLKKGGWGGSIRPVCPLVYYLWASCSLDQITFQQITNNQQIKFQHIGRHFIDRSPDSFPPSTPVLGWV